MEQLEDVETLSKTEIREYLYQYCKKNDVEVTEFHDKGTKTPYWCHLQRTTDDKTATAVGPDQNTALFMALTNFLDPHCNFLPEEIYRRGRIS